MSDRPSVEAGRILIVAVIGALLAACVSTQSASQTTTTTDGASPPAGSSSHSNQTTVGQSLKITGDSGLVATVTILSVKDYTKPKDSLIGSKPQNGEYAVADISIQVTGGSYDFNPLYFKYQAPNGQTFDSLTGNATTAGFDPSLDSGTLSAGQHTRGFVTFDVPAGNTGADIQITDPLGSVIGQWNLG